MSLNDTEIKIISLIDQRFWETGIVVTDEVVAETLRIPVKKVKDAWKKSEFREAILARGIDLDYEASSTVLDPKQVMLANMLMNAHDKTSVRQKLDMLKVSSQQYHAWLRQPAFADYLRKRAEKLFSANDFQAYKTLLDAVEGGDVNATMKFFEMRGIYNPKVQVEVNIEQVIVRVVEIVAKHVQDPIVLQAIADEIETLELGTVGSGVRDQMIPAVSAVSSSISDLSSTISPFEEGAPL